MYFADNHGPITDSKRILLTPSSFAKKNLYFIQEVGELKSLIEHKSRRKMLNSYLIVYVKSGEGIFYYKNNYFKVKKNDVIFINCHDDYFHKSDSRNPWELKWLHFNGPKLDNYFQYYYNKKDSIILSSIDNNKVEISIDSLLDTTDLSGIDKEIMESNIIYQMLTDILLMKNKNNLKKSTFKIEEIKNFIDQNFEKKISLDDLSLRFYISKYHMSRKFKNVYGVTINNYVTTKKISKSKELLRFSNLTVETIGKEIGIEDNSYFNKIFKKIEGTTPIEFRKKWNGQ